MTSLSADSEPDSIWRWSRRCFDYVRDWPANGNSPYSPHLCFFLLVAVGVIVKIGH
jgi:hypothetical protein